MTQSASLDTTLSQIFSSCVKAQYNHSSEQHKNNPVVPEKCSRGEGCVVGVSELRHTRRNFPARK